MVASAEEHEATFSSPPSFGFGTGGEEEEPPELLLYPTDQGNFIFNVETGEEVYSIKGIPTAEWNTNWPNSFWEPQFNDVYRVNRFTGEQTFNGSTPSSPYSPILWIRSEQLPGEASIPHAPISEGELIEDFRPHIKYDSQEPYGAVEPWAVTDVYGWDEEFTEVLYTNSLRRGERVLAQPPKYEWMEEEKIKYEPDGAFPLTLSSIAAEYPAFEAPDEDALADSEDFIDEHNGTHQVDAAQSYSPGLDSGIGLTRPSEEGLWLQYWIFYYYNNGTLGINDHEGDWEMIQIHLNRKTGYLPTEVIYAQHSHGNRCERGEYETEGLAPGPGGTPVIYVGNGGHASYPTEGEWASEVPLVYDSVFPNLEEWPSARLRLLNWDEQEEELMSWLSWPGKWGASGSSPRGPIFQGTRWEEPTAWAEEAQGCFDNKVSEAPLRAGSTSNHIDRVPLKVTRALLQGEQLRVGYRTNGIEDKRPSWPRMLLTADSLDDKLPPKTIVVKNVGERGRVVFPFKLSPNGEWKVRASVVSRQGRTPVVVRPVK